MLYIRNETLGFRFHLIFFYHSLSDGNKKNRQMSLLLAQKEQRTLRPNINWLVLVSNRSFFVLFFFRGKRNGSCVPCMRHWGPWRLWRRAAQYFLFKVFFWLTSLWRAGGVKSAGTILLYSLFFFQTFLNSRLNWGSLSSSLSQLVPKRNNERRRKNRKKHRKLIGRSTGNWRRREYTHTHTKINNQIKVPNLQF